MPQKISRKCYNCSGTGTVSGGGGCPVCSSIGRIDFAEVGATDEVSYIFPTHKISDATDATEYAALSDGNKAAYGMIISMGTVSLAEGTNTRLTLWALFGEGTTTRANLEALLPA